MSFGKQILEAFAAHGDRLAMVSDRSRITYRQALAEIGHLAANFMHRVSDGAFASVWP